MKLSKSLVALFLFTIFFIVSCDNRGGVVKKVEDPKDKYVIESISADPKLIYAGATGYKSNIRVVVKDETGYAVPQLPVKFKASIGSIDYEAQTDSMGIAKAEFWDSNGNDQGTSIIEARISAAVFDTVHVEVKSNETGIDQYNLAFKNQGQLTLDIQGTGGTESIPLQVEIQKNGSLYLGDDLDVHWQILSAPIGVNLAGIPSTNPEFIDEPDTIHEYIAPTLNGVSTALIFSGGEPGTIDIRAYIKYNVDLDNDGTEEEVIASVNRSNITVASGPASKIDIAYAETEELTNNSAVAGLWDIEIQATISDDYQNPVQYSTAVWWSITRGWDHSGKEVAPGDMDWANIVASSYVGGPNSNGDSLAGITYTTLTFNGSCSNDSVEVQVEIGGLKQTQVLKLPMGELDITSVPVPAHLDIAVNDNSTFRVSTIRSEVKDSQGNLIHNAKLIMYSDWGAFSFCNGETANQMSTALMPYPGPITPDGLNPNNYDNGKWHYQGVDGFFTNPHITKTDLFGISQGYLRINKYEFLPPDPQGQPQDRTCNINIQISETGKSNQLQILFRQFPTLP